MAHKKRYKKLSRQLCEQAVVECFKGKWRRNDVLTFIEKYAGIPRDDIKIDDLSGSWKYKNEAVEAIGLAMLGIVEDLVDHTSGAKGRTDAGHGRIQNQQNTHHDPASRIQKGKTTADPWI